MVYNNVEELLKAQMANKDDEDFDKFTKMKGGKQM